MRNFLLVFLIIISAMIVVLSYERILGEASFGPSALLAVSVLGLLFLLALSTFILYKTKFKETMAKIWLVLISLSVTFIFVELVASYILVKPLSPPLVPDQYRHHKLIPNTQSYFEQRDFNYYQRVNNLGLRGADIEMDKSPGIFRLLTLGDSFTMGKGVEDTQTFSVLLEELLNKNYADSIPIEVLNAGVDSYSPILSYMQLTRDLDPLKPDMIIHSLDNSDLLQERIYRQQAVYGPEKEITGVPGKIEKKSLNERIVEWTERNLFLTRLVLFYTNKLLGYKNISGRHMLTQANFEVLRHTLSGDTVQRDEQWEDIFESITKIKNYCEEKNIVYYLTIYPWGHQVNETEWTPGRYNFIPENATISDRSVETVQKLASENNIQVINLFPLFRSYNDKPPLYFNYDMHFTTAGHELMAKGLNEYLQEQLFNKILILNRR